MPKQQSAERLTPAERRTRASTAALVMHSQHSRAEVQEWAKKANDASPAGLGYYESRVDPDGVLEPEERSRRADYLRRAHMQGLALQSSKARRARGAGMRLCKLCGEPFDPPEGRGRPPKSCPACREAKAS